LTSSATAVRTDPALRCPSCQSQAQGNFCATCGETLHHHLPSAGEFAHEFIGHYVALEGKLLQTLKLLLFRPGRLTLDFLRGRRVPTIPPLRLYLTFSLIMFAMIKWYGVELPSLTLDQNTVGAAYRHKIPGYAAPGGRNTMVIRYTVQDAENTVSGETLVREYIENTIDTFGNLNQHWRDNLLAFRAQSEKQQSATLNYGFLANLPYMLIAALPLFALYLKVLYRTTRRTYGEHLVFALHANAFAFLIASVMIAIPGNVVWIGLAAHEHMLQFVSAWDYLQLLPFVWLLAYLPLAMRRVYGGTRIATAWKWAVLLTVHVLVIATCTILAELIGVMTHA
jgi:hypothetical protein